MWICPNCGADVTDDFELCWGCGTSRKGVKDPEFQAEKEGIITEAAFEAERGARTDENLFTVGTFYDVAAAYALRDLLESQGIRVTLDGEDLSAGYGSLSAGGLGGIKVQVFESSAARVREILAHEKVPFEDAPVEPEKKPDNNK